MCSDPIAEIVVIPTMLDVSEAVKAGVVFDVEDTLVTEVMTLLGEKAPVSPRH
jgi:hypothetical protein